MSQEKVLSIMRKLGGRATTAQIVAQAKIDYPDSSLWLYVGTRLTKMYEWGDIDFKDEMVDGKKKRVWFIIEQVNARIALVRTNTREARP